MASARALVVEIADPPLGATERTVASCAAEAVVRGLGLIALEHPRASLIVDAEGAALSALKLAAEAVAARLQFAAAPRSGTVLRLRPSVLAEAVWRERGEPRRVLTVAGAVQAPQVVAASPGTSVQALVAAAGPTSIAWVALWRGAVVERATSIGALIAEHGDGPRLLLVLPARHALVRRARTPMPALLRRAQSACAACAMCAPACGPRIPIPQLLRALTAGGRPRLDAEPFVAASACTACGACDLACPVGLSPTRIVDDLARRLRGAGMRRPERGPSRAPVAVLDPALALRRQGLARYDRAVPLAILTPS